jgi:hypothetical protein
MNISIKGFVGVWFAIDRAAGRIGDGFVVAVAAKGGAQIINGSRGAWRKRADRLGGQTDGKRMGGAAT